MSEQVYIHTAYDPPPAVGLDCSDMPSLTRQSEAAECDVNFIIERAQKTGFLPGTPGVGAFADVSEMGDYRTALEQVRTANDMFMALPAQIRAHFNNDPAEFLDFCSNKENLEAGRELGIFAPAPEVKAGEGAPSPGGSPAPSGG